MNTVEVTLMNRVETMFLAQARRRWLGLTILAATVVGTLMRFPFIADQSMWFDEVFTHRAMSQPNLTGLYRVIEAMETTPPLFFVLTWIVVKTVGQNTDVTIRLLSVVAGTATIPTAAFVLRRSIGPIPAMLVGWMVALSPLMVWYSLNGRSYALLMLLGLVSLWSVARVEESPTNKRLLLWACLAVLLVWTHYFSAFFIIAQFSVLMWVLRKRHAIHRLFAWGCGVAVLSAPLIPLLMYQNDGRSSYIKTIPWANRISDFVVQFPLGGSLGTPSTPGVVAVAVAFGLLGLTMGIWAVLRPLKAQASASSRTSPWALRLRKPPKQARLLVFIGAITIGVPLVLSLLSLDQHFFFRNFLFLWPLFAALVAVGLLRFKAVALVTYLGVLTFVSGSILLDWRHQNQDWKEATRVISPYAKGAPIVTFSGSNKFIPAEYSGRKINRDENWRLTTQRVWIMVEPRKVRGVLRPRLHDPKYPPKGLALTRVLTTRHGFRLLEYTSAQPSTIFARDLGEDGDGHLPGLLE